ncbi:MULTISPECIES: hypothetical protein [unclassified Psychrobacter]|uniref:hypothetical protein n=1 Tax=unclassified Psychrobacter TaxID=196806 RepID=UPI0025DFE3BC|nr:MULTISPECIES: hypothetical protein [unclassified Psychrobacter]
MSNALVNGISAFSLFFGAASHTTFKAIVASKSSFSTVIQPLQLKPSLKLKAAASPAFKNDFEIGFKAIFVSGLNTIFFFT